MPENTIIINRSIQNLIDNKLLPENREAALISALNEINDLSIQEMLDIGDIRYLSIPSSTNTYVLHLDSSRMLVFSVKDNVKTVHQYLDFSNENPYSPQPIYKEKKKSFFGSLVLALALTLLVFAIFYIIATAVPTFALFAPKVIGIVAGTIFAAILIAIIAS